MKICRTLYRNSMLLPVNAKIQLINKSLDKGLRLSICQLAVSSFAAHLWAPSAEFHMVSNPYLKFVSRVVWCTVAMRPLFHERNLLNGDGFCVGILVVSIPHFLCQHRCVKFCRLYNLNLSEIRKKLKYEWTFSMFYNHLSELILPFVDLSAV